MEITGALLRRTNVVGINQEVVIGVIAMKDVKQNLPYRFGNHLISHLKQTRIILT
jgi:hypothetical protein